MKKLKILISIVIVFIMLFSYAGVVKAADDEETFKNIFDGATFELKYNEYNSVIEATNINWNESNEEYYKSINYISFVSNQNDLTIEYLKEHYNDGKIINQLDKSSKKVMIDARGTYTDIVEKTGKLYLYITYKVHTNDEPKLVVKACELERPSLPKYTNIFPSWMMATYDATQVGLMVPHSTNNERKLQVKIGKISDDNLLKSLKENPEKNWDSLMSYAKKTSGLYDEVQKINQYMIKWVTDQEIMSIDKIEHEAYYFLYLKADGENGKYIENEGVTIAQANVFKEENTWYMFFYGDGKFAWKDFGGGDTPVSNVIVVNDINGDMSPADKTPSDNSTADKPIPQTGEHTSVVMIALVSLLGIGYVSYRRFKNTQVK